MLSGPNICVAGGSSRGCAVTTTTPESVAAASGASYRPDGGFWIALKASARSCGVWKRAAGSLAMSR